MDGKLSWQEMPGSLQRRLVQGFKMVDTNADGGLDINELYSMSKRSREARSGDSDSGAGGQ
jgi:Ca2+-binding EF-hand superfamily protein